MTYLSVSPTTSGGVAGAGGTLNAGISFSVKAADPSDYVVRVEMWDGGTQLNAINYSPVIGTNGEPSNVTRSGTRSADLGVGTHQIFLRTLTSFGSGDSPSYTVTVTGGNVAPTATLSAPGNGASYSVTSGSASVSVSGSGADSDGSVTQMEVLDFGSVIAAVGGSSINTTVSLAIGSHSIQLRATDNQGATGLSSAASVTVTQAAPPPPPPPPSPTISVSRSPSPLVAGQNQTVTWSTTNATSVSFSCTASGTGYVGSSSGLAPNSSSTSVASAAWVGYPSTCYWTASGAGGSASTSEIMTTVNPPPTGAIYLTVNPTTSGGTVPAGGTLNAGIGFSVKAADDADSIFRVEMYEGATLLNSINFNAVIGSNGEPTNAVRGGTLTANFAVGTHYIFVRARTVNGGSTDSPTYTITVTGNPIPTATLSAPTNNASYTVSSGSASVAVVGSGADSNGTVTMLEVLDAGTVIATVNAASINTSVSLAVGTHSIQLRATDNQGATGLSSAAAVTVVLAGPTISVSRTPSPMVAGQTQTVTWTTSNVTSVSYTCTSTGTGYVGNVSGLAPNSSSTSVASAAWVGYPSACTWTGTGPGGTATATETMTTVNPPAGVIYLSVSPTTTGGVTVNGTLSAGISYSVKAEDNADWVNRVELYDGGTLLVALPYSATFIGGEPSNVVRTGTLRGNLAPGTHNLFLRAYTSGGGRTDSPTYTIPVTANAVPTATLSAPVNGASYTALSVGSNTATASVPIIGSGADSDGTISTIWVLDGPDLIATVDAASINTSVALAVGSHAIQLRVFDNLGSFASSATATVNVVLAVPTISVSRTPSPMLAGQAQTVTWSTTNATTVSFDCTSSGTGYVGSATGLAANSSITGVASTAWIGYPSTCVWTAMGPGGSTNFTETLTTVYSELPTVTITSPASGTTFAAPATIPFAVTAISNGSVIGKVDYYDGTTLLGTAWAEPWSFTWPNVAQGNYSIKAVATDMAMRVGTSPSVTVIVNVPSGAGVNYLLLNPTTTGGLVAPGGLLTAGIGFQVKAVDSLDYVYRVQLFEVGVTPALTTLPFSAVIGTNGEPTNATRAGVASFDFAAGTHQIYLRAFTVNGSQGDSPTYTVTVGTGVPTIAVNWTPLPMVVGQNYTYGLATTGATSVTMVCTSTGTGYTANVTTTTVNSSQTAVAQAQWVGFPSECLWTATGPGGTVTTQKTLTTGTGAIAPSITLTASTTFARVPIGGFAYIDLTGRGVDPDGTLAKFELFRNDGTGYGAPIYTEMVFGSVNSRTIMYTDRRPIGTYHYKLRSTDNAGNFRDSTEVEVIVTSNSLLGTISGIRTDANGYPQLYGWVCQDTFAQAVTYDVFVNALPAFGGIQVGSGTADVTTELDNATVQGTCHTPSVAHHFNFNLVSFTSAYAGAPIYVRANAVSGGTTAFLPCAVNDCTMPGSLRIGLTTPADNDRYSAPATIFMRALLSNGTGPYDEIAFSVDGGAWTVGLADSTPNTYYASKVGLTSRTAPYIVMARVKQGKSTLYSVQNRVFVGPTTSTTLALVRPANNALFNSTSPIALSANLGGNIAPVVAVKFYANGALIGTGFVSSGIWTATWANALVGSYAISARAFDGTGASVAQSLVAYITVSDVGGLLPATPIAVAITPPHLSNADAGTLPGTLSVSKDGAATYGIPIDVPPGTAGLKPNLSLNYSSQGTNGPLGLGWSLGGMSSIHRCGKTIAQDGINGRITFTTRDRLCLDGQRLTLVSGALNDDTSYWADNAEYRTEIDSFSRITAQGTSSSRSFKVEAKDGRVMTYGSTATSYVNAIVGPGVTPKSGALSWALDKIVDRSNNYITFTYEQIPGTGEHRPTTIRYGGNGLPAHAAVQFFHEARPDAWKRYVDEARNDLRTRIGQIKTYVGSNLDGDVVASGTQVRTYTFHYDVSPTSGRSMLDSVQVCARTPQTFTDICLPTTTFAWGKPDPSKAPGFASRGMWANAPILTTQSATGGSPIAANHFEYFAFADFENHGFADGLEKRVASPQLNYSSLQIVIEDANSKLRGTQQSQYRYFHNTGAGFTQYNYKISTGADFVVLDIGDFNGDGAPDLLVSTQGGTRLCLSPLGSPGGLPASPATPIVFTCGSLDTSGAFANDSYRLPYVIDVYGNGRSAYYSPVSDFLSSGTFCNPVADPSGGMKGNCFADANAPALVLGYTYSLDGNPLQPQHDYVRFNEMVDFPGTGRASDVRWTKPQNIQARGDNGEPVGGHICFNRTPTVRVTSFQLPSTTATVPSAADTFASYTYPTYTQPAACGVSTIFAPYLFDTPHQGAGLAADFNGSGYSSLAFGFRELSQTTPGTFSRSETTICISTGRGLDCGIRQKYSGAAYQPVRAVGHFVGDGQPTILVESGPGNVQMCSLTGDDPTSGTAANDPNMVCTAWPGVTMKSDGTYAAVDKTYFMDLLGTGRTQMVLYHSGGFTGPGGAWVEDGRWEVFEPIDRAAGGQALDRIHQVTNGVGNASVVEYADGVASGVVSRSANLSQLVYPQHATGGVGRIVSRLRVGNGVSGERTIRYVYKDAANDVNGRGSLGFREVTSTDEQTNISTTNTYAQAFPFTGMPVSSIARSAFGVMSDTQNRYLRKDIPQSNGATTVFPFLAGSVVTLHDLDGASSKGTVTTAGVSPAGADMADVQYDNWGNTTGSKVTSVGSALNAAYSSATGTVNTFFAPDTSHWLVGLLQSSAVTKKQSTDGTGVTRTVDYTYEPDFSGRVKTETLQSGDATLALKLTTSYNHHATFGVVTGKTVTWRDLFTAADVSQGETTAYDAKARFPATITNALGQSETHLYDPGSGARTSLTGPNLLTTAWTVDGFGRVNVETRADGNETRQYRKQCAGDCPPSAVTAEISDSFHGADRIAVPQIAYRDNAGHLLRTKTWGFDGRAIVSDQRYDSIGRLFETDQPRFELDTSYLARRQVYDDLGRVKTLTVFDDTGAHDTITTYQGFVIEITNPKSQTRFDNYDVLGRVVQVKDPNGKLTSFTYDQFGNLKKTTDPNGNVITVLYDDRGRKIKLTDPDLGIIDYFVDARDLVWKQISPRQRAAGQFTRSEYDVLGRMTGRYESDLESHWIFDTAYKGIGQLTEAYTGTPSLKDYRRTHTYDGLGRPSVTTQYLTDGSYTAQTDYDSWGRVIANTYRRGIDAAKAFDSRYNAYGYLSQLQRGSLVLWRLSKQDASQRSTEVALSNGLTQTRQYDLNADRLKNATLKTAGQTLRLQEDYQYDALGNVLQRSQYWDVSGFVESFTYDALNRLKSSAVVGQATLTFTFDDAGNIKSKSDVGPGGQYVYPTQGPNAVRPHGVIAIPGVSCSTCTYLYDANGNLYDMGNSYLSVTWTSYDMPVQITRNYTYYSYSNFVYGPEHQRTRQTRNDGRTVIYAGTQEVESVAGQVTVKTYWPYGVGVEIDRPNAGTEFNWVHVDRLGSPVAISDSSGTLKEKLAYDAWGKRRTLDGAPFGGTATPNSIDGQVDNRGFTGHEMLDLLDLVHMNGRVYDPLLGKFLSADPLVQDPMNGQSYNRYSYVLNNPTNLTDPTGFACISTTGSNIPIACEGRSLDDQVVNHIDGSRQVVRGDGSGKTLESQGLKMGPNNVVILDSKKPSVVGGKETAGSPGVLEAAGKAITGALAQARNDLKWNLDHPSQTFENAVAPFGGEGTAIVGASTMLGKASGKAMSWFAKLFSKEEAVQSVWSLNPFKRGLEIERALGQNLPKNFPVIDKFEAGLATSIKSLDLNAASYQNAALLSRTLTGHVDSIAGFTGRTWAGVSVNGVTARAIELAVPNAGSPAQQAAISAAVRYGETVGVQVKVIVFP